MIQNIKLLFKYLKAYLSIKITTIKVSDRIIRLNEIKNICNTASEFEEADKLLAECRAQLRALTDMKVEADKWFKSFCHSIF